ncbi:MAG: hypothetical protein ABIC36_00725 [bacterium]
MKNKKEAEKCPIVLQKAKAAVKNGLAGNWGKGTGGPYPWRKK